MTRTARYTRRFTILAGLLALVASMGCVVRPAASRSCTPGGPTSGMTRTCTPSVGFEFGRGSTREPTRDITPVVHETEVAPTQVMELEATDPQVQPLDLYPRS